MKKYRYGGLEPVPDGEGSMVRPGEVREFKALPGYGPWEAVAEEPQEAPPPPAPPAPPAAPAAPSSTATPPAAGNGGN